jgi:hypothetical protein
VKPVVLIDIQRCLKFTHISKNPLLNDGRGDIFTGRGYLVTVRPIIVCRRQNLVAG